MHSRSTFRVTTFVAALSIALPGLCSTAFAQRRMCGIQVNNGNVICADADGQNQTLLARGIVSVVRNYATRYKAFAYSPTTRTAYLVLRVQPIDYSQPPGEEPGTLVLFGELNEDATELGGVGGSWALPTMQDISELAVDATTEQLYYVRRNTNDEEPPEEEGLFRVSGDGMTSETLLSYAPAAMAFDSDDRKLYYMSEDGMKLMRASVADMSTEIFSTFTDDVVSAIAFDRNDGSVYALASRYNAMTTEVHNIIIRIAADGTQTDIHDQGPAPGPAFNAIAVDTAAEQLYYTVSEEGGGSYVTYTSTYAHDAEVNLGGWYAFLNVIPDCGASEYLSGDTCTACTSCIAGEYRVARCGDTANTACTICTACGTHQYETSACGFDVDRTCGECDESCAACTGPSASECTGCPANHYLSTGACTVCTTCGPGEHLVSACSASADAVCAPNEDAGVPTMDASVAPDANIATDADVTADAGVAVDANHIEDAQAHDASADAMSRDAATDIGSLSGGGGCDCNVNARGGAWGNWPLFAFVTLVIMGRRRRV